MFSVNGFKFTISIFNDNNNGTSKNKQEVSACEKL